MKTNFEHLQSLNARSMALAIWNYASDYCAYCPKNMECPCGRASPGPIARRAWWSAIATSAPSTAARESASG